MRETQSLKNDPTPGTLYWISMAKFCPEFRGKWRWREPNPTSIRTPSTEKVKNILIYLNGNVFAQWENVLEWFEKFQLTKLHKSLLYFVACNHISCFVIMIVQF